MYNRTIRKIHNQIKNWPVGVIIANGLTLLTLIFSIVQNNKNEIDNNLELKRIRTRDSIQSYRDSIKTDLLIEQLVSQVNENKRNRIKDSSQLSLFNSQIKLLNKSLKSQNEGIKIQNKSLIADLLAKQSQLILNVGLGVDNYKYGSASPILSYSLTNVGNSIAQNIITNYCIVSIDHSDNHLISCINSVEASFNEVSIRPGELVILRPLISMGLPLVKGKEYTKLKKDKLDELYKRHSEERMNIEEPARSMIFKRHRKEEMEYYEKYPREDYTNFIIVKVSYTDKYQELSNEVYAILSVDYFANFVENQIRVDSRPTGYSKFSKLIKCIRENNFNEEQIKQQLKRSSSKNENTFSVNQ